MSAGLGGILSFVLPRSLLEWSLEALARIGTQRAEGFVVWGGVHASETVFRFETGLVPEQRAYSTEDGLLVTVDGDALHKINVTFNESGLMLAGQIHSHPTGAYHSSTDDHLPLVTVVGGLSVVVPDFAQDGIGAFERFAWYRLASYANWIEVDPARTVELS
jgi:proteasome lid subunit RPN8/RPN11